MSEVIIIWPIGADPREEKRIDAEIGRVLRTLLPCSQVVYADMEGVRLKVSKECMSEVWRLAKTARYLEFEVEVTEG